MPQTLQKSPPRALPKNFFKYIERQGAIIPKLTLSMTIPLDLR